MNQIDCEYLAKEKEYNMLSNKLELMQQEHQDQEAIQNLEDDLKILEEDVNNLMLSASNEALYHYK
jgi:hypothetical protein